MGSNWAFPSLKGAGVGGRETVSDVVWEGSSSSESESGEKAKKSKKSKKRARARNAGSGTEDDESLGEKARKKIQAQFSSLLNTNAVKRQFLSSFGGKGGSKARKVRKSGAASSPSCVEGGGGSAEAQEGETAWAEAEAAWDRACAEADRDGAAEDEGDAAGNGAAAAKARVVEAPVGARNEEGAGAAPPGAPKS